MFLQVCRSCAINVQFNCEDLATISPFSGGYDLSTEISMIRAKRLLSNVCPGYGSNRTTSEGSVTSTQQIALVWWLLKIDQCRHRAPTLCCDVCCQE